MTLINRTPTSVLYRYNVGVAVHAGNYYNKKVYTCSMVPDVQSIREYQNFPNSYMLFTKVSMRLCISHSLCSAVHNYDSLCRRSSRSPIMLSILLVYMYIFIYIRSTVRRALNLLRASFSPIFQYFSAVNITRISFSPVFQYFVTYVYMYAMRHAPRNCIVGHGFFDLEFVGNGFVSHRCTM